MFKLNSGESMPMIGLGTLQLTGRKVKEVLDLALGAGYRLIDTAAVYRNEEEIGNALRELLPKYNLKRADIFICTKVPATHHGEKVTTALKSSLHKLKCQYIDLYLVHWPGQQGKSPVAPNNPDVRSDTWKALVKAQSKGLVKNIGVANYTVHHITELLENNHGVLPAVNQVEWHPHCYQAELKALCDKHGILIQAYSSLGGSKNTDLLDDATVANIAKKLNRTPAQILLRWAIQQNVAVIPKASTLPHLEENLELSFEIPKTEFNALNAFEQRRYGWDPSSVS